MKKETMTLKEKLKWYTDFIEEASKLGKVDPDILKRKAGIVEELRLEYGTDPEEAAVGYLAVQKRAQERGETPDKHVPRCPAEEEYDEFQEWFQRWFLCVIAGLGDDIFKEFRQIMDDSIQAYAEKDPFDAAKTIKGYADRVHEVCEWGADALRADVVEAGQEVMAFLLDMIKDLERRAIMSLPGITTKP